MKLEPFVIGIDLGGTNVRVSAVSLDGKILSSEEVLIEAARGPKAGVERISGLITHIQAQTVGELVGIGIGSTGPVDRDLGAIQNPYTLPTWENVDIVHPLSRQFGVPVTLENDADAAALGEQWVGAGQGVRSLAAVTVGTGIGTAFIRDGHIYRGLGGVHGEGGHQVLDPAGPDCYCGARGCWEMLAAGPAIALYAREQAARRPTRMLEMAGGNLENIDAALVTKAARAGDELANELVQRTAYYLGLGMVNMILFYLPDAIVLSGGVMKAYDLLEPGIRAVIARHSLLVPADKVKILLSTLGRQAGVLGAARAILNELEEVSK